MDNDGRLDLNGLSQHLKRLTEAKIDVILLMGSIGEFASFTFEERLHLIRKVRAMSSLKMVANVSSTSQNDVLLMAKEAYRAGYEAVMILPPYYYGQTTKQLLSYFRQFGQKLRGKWFAYNFPAPYRVRFNAGAGCHPCLRVPQLRWHQRYRRQPVPYP